jgi:hypothetical protein
MTYDPTREPLRAIRDLIEACEADGHMEGEALDNARAALAALRKIFGDDRPNEVLAFELPIEPAGALLAGIEAPLSRSNPHA